MNKRFKFNSITQALHLFAFQQLSGLGLLMSDVGLPEIQAELKVIADKIREQGEKALAEAGKGIAMSTKAMEKVDEMLIKQGELQARLQEAEQKLAQRVEATVNAVKSIGAQLAQSPEFKAWMDSGGMKSTQSGFLFQMPGQTWNAAIVTTDLADTKTTTIGVRPDMQPGIFMLPDQRLTVRDLITPGRTGSNLIQYVKETGFTNNAAPVSENTTKPESTITFSLTQTAVITIAHWVKASKQILDDFAQLQSNIDGRLRYGLKLVEEAQLLKGSGVGNNLNGIYTQATSYSAPIVVAAPNKIDTLRLMLLQAELALYPPSGILLHPADWAAIELTKDSTKGYIFANPQSLARPALWGLPVVATQAMTVDTALVGAFRLGAQLFDREDANVVISTENQDDFIKNMITIRAEERLGLAVYRPEAFIKNTNLPSS